MEKDRLEYAPVGIVFNCINRQHGMDVCISLRVILIGLQHTPQSGNIWQLLRKCAIGKPLGKNLFAVKYIHESNFRRKTPCPASGFL